MPTYRSINIELHSQFDIETIPEYRPRLQEYYASIGNPGKVPPFLDEKTATCSVYIPVLPGSQFWIGYSVSPPVPEDQQFLFKLFINGAHIVNWSTGKEHDWKGKTMFGLFERTYEDGKTRVEKRVLCFTPPNRKTKQWTDVTDAFDEEAYMEIQVHRAHASKRIEKQIQDYNDTAHGKSRRGIEYVYHRQPCSGRANAPSVLSTPAVQTQSTQSASTSPPSSTLPTSHLRPFATTTVRGIRYASWHYTSRTLRPVTMPPSCPLSSHVTLKRQMHTASKPPSRSQSGKVGRCPLAFLLTFLSRLRRVGSMEQRKHTGRRSSRTVYRCRLR
jgi:hypothetical protein